MENERSTIPPNAADEDASTPRGSVGITSGGRICVGDGGIHRHKDGQACACNRQVGRNRGRLAAECVGGRKRMEGESAEKPATEAAPECYYGVGCFVQAPSK